VDNGQLTPKPVSADTGGAGNFTVDRNPNKPKNWWDKAVQGTQNFFKGVGHAIGNTANWINQNVVKAVDNFLNSTIGQYVGSALVGGLLAGVTILAAPEETAIGGTLVLGDILAGMGRSVLGKTIGDFLDGTIGTVKTDSGMINPTTSPLPKAGGEINAESGDVENEASRSEVDYSGKDIKFDGNGGKSGQKLSTQMSNRGWSQSSVRDTVDNPYTTRSALNKGNTNGPATAFFNEDGSYVVDDDETHQVVQISDKTRPWTPDSTITNPYTPKK
jgi:hypothetical protein